MDLALRGPCSVLLMGQADTPKRHMIEVPRRKLWLHNVSAGAVWMLVYNCVWGLAWFGLMRSEWERAALASGRRMPWTPDVWIFWILLTLPIGMAIMAFSAGHEQRTPRAALTAGAAVWSLLTIGMVGFGWAEGLSIRVLLLDSVVNLIGIVAASLISAWMQIKTRIVARSRRAGNE